MPEFHWSSDLFDQLNEVHLSMLIILILCHMPCHILAMQNNSFTNQTEKIVYFQSVANRSTPVIISFNNSRSTIHSEMSTNISIFHNTELNVSTLYEALSINNTVKAYYNTTSSNDTMLDFRDSNVKQRKRDINALHNKTLISNRLEENMRDPNQRRTYKEQELLANKIISPEQPDPQYVTINPPSKIKKILQRYPAAASSRVFKEFFAWNEKCMAVAFTQAIKVEEHELREALALKQNINMGLRDAWRCESLHLTNKFCFGVCRSFRYPIQDTSPVYQQASLPLNSGPALNSIDKSARDMIAHLKKSSQHNPKKDGVTYESSMEKGFRTKQKIRLRRSAGFFCSACVPVKVKYQEVSLICQPNNDADLTLVKTQETMTPDENPNNIMLFFLNRFGITPNINVQNDTLASGTSKNAILKTLAKPSFPKGYYKEGMNVTIVKKVPVVETCNCQPCSSHDMFL